MENIKKFLGVAVVLFGISYLTVAFLTSYNEIENEQNDKSCQICGWNLSHINIGKILIDGTPHMGVTYTVINDKDFTEFKGHMLKVLSYKDGTKNSVKELQIDLDIYTFYDDYGQYGISKFVEIDDEIYLIEPYRYESEITYTKIGEIGGYSSFRYYSGLRYWEKLEEECGISLLWKARENTFFILCKSSQSYDGYPYLNSEYMYDWYVKLETESDEINELFLSISNSHLRDSGSIVAIMVDVFIDFDNMKCVITYARGSELEHSVSIDFELCNDDNWWMVVG